MTTTPETTGADPAPSNPGEPLLERATLAGGCFWCLEAAYQQVRGVHAVQSGYTGGRTPDPSYDAVCTGQTGHAEAVAVTFDPAVVSYHDLLEIFFTIHDPTTLNRQGADVGTQYRSAIYYHSPEQKATAEQVMTEITAAGLWSNPLVTQLEPAGVFYPAEAYHDNYYRRNPRQSYCYAVIEPKLSKFRARHAALMKEG